MRTLYRNQRRKIPLEHWRQDKWQYHCVSSIERKQEVMVVTMEIQVWPLTPKLNMYTYIGSNESKREFAQHLLLSVLPCGVVSEWTLSNRSTFSSRRSHRQLTRGFEAEAGAVHMDRTVSCVGDLR